MIRSHDTPARTSHGMSTASYYGFSRYNGAYTYPHKGPDSMVYVLPSDSNDASITGEPVTKNAGSRWREDETEALVEIWRDKICQTRWWKQSKGVRVNKEMWEEIAKILIEKDIYRTPSQCQIRMKNLLQFYRQTIDNRRSEKSMDELPEYFDIVDSIMTRRDAVTNDTSEKSNSNEAGEGVSMPTDENNNDHDRKESYTSSSLSCSEKDVEMEEQKSERKEENISSPTTNSFRSFMGKNSNNSVIDSVPYDVYNAASHWEAPSSSMACCDSQHSPTKKLPNERDYPSYPPEMSRRYAPYNRHYLRATANQQDRRYINQMPITTPVPPHVHKMSLPNHPESEWNGCNNTVSLRFIQELLNLQYKQMENFLEIEKKRLEIEKTRLQEDRESVSRNSAFLMEAVKILAETFRKPDDQKKENK